MLVATCVAWLMATNQPVQQPQSSPPTLPPSGQPAAAQPQPAPAQPQPAPAAGQPQPPQPAPQAGAPATVPAAPAQPQPQPGTVQPAPAQPPPAQWPPAGQAPAAPTAAPAPDPTQNPEYVDARRQRRTGIILTATGWSVFGASYLLSAMVATITADASTIATADGDPDAERYRRISRRMLVPAIGPWMTLPETATASGAFFVVFSGLLQTGGLAMGITGPVLLARGNKRLAALSVRATPGPDGGRLSLSLRF